MACLDANAVQDYLRAPAEDEARIGVEDHLDGCDSCRALVAAAAQLVARPTALVDLGTTAIPVGAHIARYIIGERIGGGSMGVVYAAEDPELRRKIAIKLIGPGGAAGALADERLLREAQALARISHPHVISVFDVGTHEEHVFLAMELVDGGDLRAWLDSRPRTVAEIVEVFTAAGRGLAAAHAAGLVHRDFKPDNVLIGVDGRVRVTDFGLARIEPAAAPVPDALPSNLTQPHRLIGTPAYMAPEQLHRGGAADAASDQWSFCVALYEALYGHRPFSGRSLGDLCQAVLAGRVEDEPGHAVPTSLRRILLRGLSVRPSDRFASMAALLAALARDHVRGARRIVFAALVGLVAIAATLAGDSIVRQRSDRATRAELAAASQQLDRGLALRAQAFADLARPTSVLPVIREVAGNVDRAEFGFGDAAADLGRLELLHENLASADWSMWTHDGTIAVSDYKGRLVYSSGAPHAAGTDLRLLEAVARAYDPDFPGVSAMVVRGDDPALAASGLLAEPQLGLVVVLARAAVPGGVPRAVFAQAIGARQLLEDLALGRGLELSLVAPDGTPEGDVPSVVATGARARPDVPQDLRVDGTLWLALAHPLGTLEAGPRLATVVIARPADRGLEASVAHGRVLLAVLAAVLLGAGLAAAARTRVGRAMNAPVTVLQAP